MSKQLPIQNAALLREALTHPSARTDSAPDNQRLEFLGDAVIQIVVSEEIYRLHPDQPEGVMTKLRAAVVSRTALASLARSLALPEQLFLAPQADRMGARSLPSTLADAVEAVAGAIFLEGGLDAARAYFRPLFQEKLAHLPVATLEEENPRSRLQEILQEIVPESPTYEDVASEGPSHAPTFQCRVIWQGRTLGKGSGSGKKAARREAAADALRKKLWKINR